MAAAVMRSALARTTSSSSTRPSSASASAAHGRSVSCASVLPLTASAATSRSAQSSHRSDGPAAAAAAGPASAKASRGSPQRSSRPSASCESSPSLSTSHVGATIHTSQLHLSGPGLSHPLPEEPSASAPPPSVGAPSTPVTPSPLGKASAHASDGRRSVDEAEPAMPPSSVAAPPALMFLGEAALHCAPISLGAVSPTARPSSQAATPTHRSPGSAGTQRTLPSSLSASLPRLPFFLRAPSAAPASPTKAPTTAAGPAGYLASLEPQAASSPRSHTLHDGLPSPSARSALPTPPLRRPSVPPSEAPAGAKRATFLRSVALALGRASISQRALAGVGGGGLAGDPTASKGGVFSPEQAARALRRPSGVDGAPQPGGLNLADAVADASNEVVPLSPHFLGPRTPNAAEDASAAAAISRADLPQGPCTFHAGVLPGNLSYLPLAASPSSSSSQRERCPPQLPGSPSPLSQRFLESWSESDDPLSPASFQEIVPGVFLGSAKSALNVGRLLQHRITHILSVMNRPLNFFARPDDAADADQLSFGGARHWEEDDGSARCVLPSAAPSAHPLFVPVVHGLSVHFVYLLDVPEADLLSALDDCLPFLAYAEQHSRGRVLIHCQAGISRSASVVIAYLVHRFGWSVREAWERCSDARPYVNPNEGFVSQLDLFAKAAQRKLRRERARWRERARRWWAAGARGRQLLRSDAQRHIRPKPLPADARREGEHDRRQHSSGEEHGIGRWK